MFCGLRFPGRSPDTPWRTRGKGRRHPSRHLGDSHLIQHVLFGSLGERTTVWPRRLSPKASGKLVAGGVDLAQTRQAGRVHLWVVAADEWPRETSFRFAHAQYSASPRAALGTWGQRWPYATRSFG